MHPGKSVHVTHAPQCRTPCLGVRPVLPPWRSSHFRRFSILPVSMAPSHLYKSTGHISKNFCSLSTVEWIIHLAGLTVVSVGGHVPPCAAGLVQTCPELSGEGASSPHSWSQQGRRVPRRPWEGRAAMLPSWVRSEREKETECMHPTCIFQLGNRTPI